MQTSILLPTSKNEDFGVIVSQSSRIGWCFKENTNRVGVKPIFFINKNATLGSCILTSPKLN